MVPLEFNPTFIATDRKGRFVLSSYYQGAHVGVHPVGDDGSVGGNPVVWLETATGAHSMQTDPTNRYAFVPHIAGNGPNCIYQFPVRREHRPDRTQLPGAGGAGRIPRPPGIFCFHPSLDVLYFSNEQGCSVGAYRLNTASGTLSQFQTAPTIPEDFTERNTCSQIQVTGSGRFLYAPNRGHNSIRLLHCRFRHGRTWRQRHCRGRAYPNALAVGPGEKFLYSAGVESGNMATFGIDAGTGQLSRVATTPLGNRPAWISIVQLP